MYEYTGTYACVVLTLLYIGRNLEGDCYLIFVFLYGNIKYNPRFTKLIRNATNYNDDLMMRTLWGEVPKKT